MTEWGQNGCENGEHDADRPAPSPVTPLLRALALPAALVATLALTSCGSSPSPSASAPTAGATPTAFGTPARDPVNKADVDFSTMMIATHKQSVTMVDLALERAADAKVKALAPKIKTGVVPEVTRMSEWWTSQGNIVPDGTHDMSMPGMEAASPEGVVSAKEMTDLGKATGSGFDRMWLQLMVRHHKGAVAMARTELTKGSSPDGKQVAQSIIDRQSAEITTMTSILTGLPKS